MSTITETISPQPTTVVQLGRGQKRKASETDHAAALPPSRKKERIVQLPPPAPSSATTGSTITQQTRRYYLAAVHEIRKDIEKLKNQLKDKRQSNEIPSEIIDYLLRSSELHARSVSEVDQEGPESVTAEERQAELLRSFVQLSGITFTQSQHKLIIGANDTPVRRYRLRGVAHGLGFSVCFDVDEKELNIVKLSIKLDDSDLQVALAPFIQRIERDHALHMFFKGFSRYAELCSRRRALFQSMRSKYGAECIQLTHGLRGAVMEFIAPCMRLVFEWRVGVQYNGADVTLSQTLDLTPYASEKAKQLDKHHLLQQLPHKFHLLLTLKGVETALDIMFQLVSGPAQCDSTTPHDEGE